MNAFDKSNASIDFRDDAPIIKKKMPALSIETMQNAQAWRISRRVNPTKAIDPMIAVCEYTGIAINIEIPAIPNKVFEYSSPFANFANVKGMVYQGESYLTQLDTQILAGLFITCYRHYNLLHESPNSTGVLMNAMLRTAGKQTLIDALLFSEHLSIDRAKKCPRISLNYETYKDSNLFPAVIYEYIKTLGDTLYPPANRRIDDNDDIEEAIKKRVRISSKDREHATQLAADKRTAKDLITTISNKDYIAPAIIMLLKQVVSNRNLVTLSNELRDKIVTKLRAKGIEELNQLAKIIESHRPTDDIFSTDNVANALDRASDHFTSQPVRKKSLKEILAEKKGQANASASNQAQQDTNGSDF